VIAKVETVGEHFVLESNPGMGSETAFLTIGFTKSTALKPT